jgi:hypothetical protein
MKRLLMQLEREHPGVKASLLKALGNVMPRHLLDTRLNPVGQGQPAERLNAGNGDESDVPPAAGNPGIIPLVVQGVSTGAGASRGCIAGSDVPAAE